MDNLIKNLAVEIGFFVILGLTYYIYQRKKILRDEENKIPMIMEYLLEVALNEREIRSNHELDSLIEKLDDFVKNPLSQPPTDYVKIFYASPECSEDFRLVIKEALIEIED